MAFRVYDIRKTPPDTFPFYFLDANVWIYYLKPRSTLKREEQLYVRFVDGIIRLSDEHPDKPKFVWCSILLSEIINTLLRIDMKSRGMSDFKNQYRPSNFYRNSLSALVSDLQGFEPYIKLVEDGFTTMDVFNGLLMNFSPSVDFNDLYYVQLVRSMQGTAIVTNDGDFQFEDVPIVTLNTALLSL